MMPPHAPTAHPSVTSAVTFQSRRSFLLTTATLLQRAVAAGNDNPPQKLDLRLTEGFEESGVANVKAVLLSAAKTLWQHCPHTDWQTNGFEVFRSPASPITLHKHRPDGRIAIGLTADKGFWCQYAFQFAHEFAHALASHSNTWRENWIGDHGCNQWFEESLCETASLFALRAMGHEWATSPPFPNWRNYATNFAPYVEHRLRSSHELLPDPKRFGEWFQTELPSLRSSAKQREKNIVIARHLLPLFERDPSGWESLTTLNRTSNRDPQKPWNQHLSDWLNSSHARHHAFVQSIIEAFGTTQLPPVPSR